MNPDIVESVLTDHESRLKRLEKLAADTLAIRQLQNKEAKDD